MKSYSFFKRIINLSDAIGNYHQIFPIIRVSLITLNEYMAMASVMEIKAIIREQKERMHKLVQDSSMIEREHPFDIDKLTRGAATIIMGPRRCGKSTFAFQLLKEKQFGYVNFDDERLNISKDELNKVLEAIYSLEGDVEILLFDEIQEVEGWEKFISRLVDEKKVIITGSNSKLLSREFSTYITGRHIDYELLPFSFREFLLYYGFTLRKDTAYTSLEKTKIIDFLEDYFKLGGFPLALKLGEGYLVDLYKDIVERDITQRHRIRLSSKLSVLFRYLMTNYASEHSYNKLRNIIGISGNSTVSEWVGYFEQAYVIFVLERFSFKLKESIMAPRKIYSIDNGLVTINTIRKEYGNLMENTVGIQLFRSIKLNHNNFQINYWKDHQQREVDFLIRQGSNVKHLIQVTFASDKMQIKDREIQALIKASSELKCDNLTVITWDYEDETMIDDKSIMFIPLWKWLITSMATA